MEEKIHDLEQENKKLSKLLKDGIGNEKILKIAEAVCKAELLSLEDVSRAIKDYCCDLIDAGKDMVEVTEFNADLQKILSREIFGKETE